MFTIRDVHGHVIGFTGRILTDAKDQPKYVNTPETMVYKKSHVLYGLDKARGEIKREDLAVIVEGNMDVLSSHQFGTANVVAASGTALTTEQLQLLKRFTNHLAIAFDGDAAGGAATVRGLDLARQQDFDIRIISIPPELGKDADDVVRKDPEAWKHLIKTAIPVMDWVYRRAFIGKDTSKPDEKKHVVLELGEELQRISNSVERDGWLKRLASDLDVSYESIRDSLRTIPKNGGFTRFQSSPSFQQSESVPRPPAAPKPQEKPVKSREDELEERLQALLYLAPELEGLAQQDLGAYHTAYSPDTERLNYLAAFADREFQDQTSETLRRELSLATSELRKLRINRHRQDLEQQMREAERVGDEARITSLLEQFNHLI